MRYFDTRPLILLLMVLIAGLPGCVKFKQVVTVFPDGSGKMHMSMAINEQMLTMAGDEDPFADFSIHELADQEALGWSAFSEPRVYSADGFKTVEFTGYFLDINAVSFGGDAPAGDEADAPADGEIDQAPEPSTTFQLVDGKLTVTGGMVAQMINEMGSDPSLNDPQTRAMMAPMMQGLEISETYVLPGDVQQADGYTADGRTAALTVTSDDLLGDQPFTVAALEDGTSEITFDPAPWDDQKAWRAEFAAAQAAWTELKARAVEVNEPAPVGAE